MKVTPVNLKKRGGPKKDAGRDEKDVFIYLLLLFLFFILLSLKRSFRIFPALCPSAVNEIPTQAIAYTSIAADTERLSQARKQMAERRNVLDYLTQGW